MRTALFAAVVMLVVAGSSHAHGLLIPDDKTLPPLGMVYVPPGTFRMGWESSTVIGGDVTLTHGYFMDRYEVSGALWTVVRNWALLHGYAISAGGFRASDHPVQSMTWNDAAIWCNARSQMEGLTPCYYMENTKANVWKAGNIQPLPSFVNWTANGYRLPTEAEWERAARGGLDRKVYPWGDTIANHQANYSESGDPFETSGGGAAADAGTTPIGYYNGSQVPAGQNMANGFGLYDMAGNVWEFCWDWYSTSAPSGQTDPTGPMSGSYRSLKGGSWGDSNSISLSCAFKANWETQIVSRSVSFRCVRSL